MIVQIYEVRTPEEAGALARLGVDHIGVLVGNGAFPRELTADCASAVFAALPARAQRVALSLSADPRGDCAGGQANPAAHYPYRGGGRAVLGRRHAGAQGGIPGCADHAGDPDHRRGEHRMPTFCCSTATSPATDRSAGLAARTTGASAGALSTKWVCRSSLPAASTPTTSWQRLPQCVRRASIRKPRRTEPTAMARISTRCAASSLPRSSPCQGSSPQLDGPVVLYHAQ